MINYLGLEILKSIFTSFPPYLSAILLPPWSEESSRLIRSYAEDEVSLRIPAQVQDCVEVTRYHDPRPPLSLLRKQGADLLIDYVTVMSDGALKTENTDRKKLPLCLGLCTRGVTLHGTREPRSLIHPGSSGNRRSPTCCHRPRPHAPGAISELSWPKNIWILVH